MMMTTETVFAITRNRAVWKCYDTIDAARERLEELAPRVELSQRLTGFDAAGQTAIVERPVVWLVEELEPGPAGRLIADRLQICPACRAVTAAAQSCECRRTPEPRA